MSRSMAPVIRTMRTEDAVAVLRVYQEGIDSGHATFQDSAGTWASWDAGHLSQCRLVAEIDGGPAGWAGLSAVSNRCVYAGVAEVSIYVAGRAARDGVGRMLLEALVRASEAAQIWTLHAGIFPENTASLNLHQRCGFRVVGTQARLGRMSYGPFAGRWRDVVLLERRSEIVGTD